ncbi:iron chelate uptake ABC transporter family permease subunit [Domibacillus sp. DTU_2020_1001157_1_SI_ALB_TIR_016]|uniref:FecCD family ABC transporter permease n=1 Tax=Domibacillus sp. DTU_2020_1001157_1_SI_ALB_TIR_016 TaxID=3077789 RepID=UPI0028E991C3|nr:iron chelate uptake ABC transporter family permease subunit [Domibacillus sp. DTU_2020_1001157_1_SI_ALB_TIR_016]WNS79033.1 iron chelate uptake ABC transporter family permease subunit [Domibacillus sp. DTU_2020_1001157_1_SI_ALB_TIR_016]
MRLTEQTTLNKKRRPLVLLFILTVLLLLLSAVSLGVGAVYISPLDIIADLAGTGASSHAFILHEYRLPRLYIAMIAGAGLAMAGAVLQGILRNPLASPDVIGVTKGAGLAAVIVIVLFPESPVFWLPVSAFLGAAAAAAALMLFAHKNGVKPATLALIGIALGAIFQAGIEYFMIKFPDDVNSTLLWLAGSLWGRGWEQVWMLLPSVPFGIALWLLSAKLDILHLGEDLATGLGQKTKQLRYVLLSLSVIIIGMCVAAIGSIGFIGLIAPHVARKLTGSRHKFLLPVSALIGALFLLAADSLGRGLFPPIEIPAGIVTAVIGAPYFLYLLRREGKKA